MVCDNAGLLYEEQPDAYKEVGDIIRDLQEAGIIRVLAVLRPVLTYKTRSHSRAPGQSA